MRNRIEKIRNAMREGGVKKEIHRDVLIYLLVGIFSYKLEVVADWFKITEQKVYHITSVYHKKLNDPRDRSFFKKMHYVTRLVKGVKSNKEQLFSKAA